VVIDAELNGTTPSVEHALVGRDLDDVAAALVEFGAPGERIATALARADGSRL